MLKGLTRAGIGKVDLESFIQLASGNGFDAVDASGSELEQWAGQRGLESARDFLQEQRIRIGSIGLAVQWRAGEDEFQGGLVRLAKDAEIAAKLDCRACCTYVLPSVDDNAARFMAVATRRLRTCAQILGAYGIRLGLEFVGPHHLRTKWANPFIWDADSTLDWIGAIDEENVGLLYDSYHWYTNSLTADHIMKLTPKQIVHVHLNDAPDVPVEEALDNGRLYPGEGVIPLAEFLQALNRIGYRGVVSQEILTAQPPGQTPEELARRSGEAFRAVYRTAGLQE